MTFVKCLESQDKFSLLRSSAKINLALAMDEGTNIRAMKIIYQNKPEELETLIYRVLELGRDLLMVKDSEQQSLVLLNSTMDILENPDNAVFTLEEIIYAVRKGASGGYEVQREYGKINSEIINLWLYELYIEHITVIEDDHIRRKDLNESGRTTPVLVNSFDDQVSSEVSRRLKNFNIIQERKKEKSDEKFFENNNVGMLLQKVASDLKIKDEPTTESNAPPLPNP